MTVSASGTLEVAAVSWEGTSSFFFRQQSPCLVLLSFSVGWGKGESAWRTYHGSPGGGGNQDAPEWFLKIILLKHNTQKSAHIISVWPGGCPHIEHTYLTSIQVRQRDITSLSSTPILLSSHFLHSHDPWSVFWQHRLILPVFELYIKGITVFFVSASFAHCFCEIHLPGWLCHSKCHGVTPGFSILLFLGVWVFYSCLMLRTVLLWTFLFQSLVNIYMVFCWIVPRNGTDCLKGMRTFSFRTHRDLYQFTLASVLTSSVAAF